MVLPGFPVGEWVAAGTPHPLGLTSKGISLSQMLDPFEPDRLPFYAGAGRVARVDAGAGRVAQVYTGAGRVAQGESTTVTW